MRNALQPLRSGLTTLLAASLLYSVSAAADCLLPAPPSHIPDGHSANEQEMQTAMRTFKQYNEDVDEYMKCLYFEQRRDHLSYGDEVTHRTAALDTLTSVLERFNAQVRIYKSRHT
jgi:hypothetical protein